MLGKLSLECVSLAGFSLWKVLGLNQEKGIVSLGEQRTKNSVYIAKVPCSKNVNSIVKQNFKVYFKVFYKTSILFENSFDGLDKDSSFFCCLFVFGEGSLYIAQQSWNMLCRPDCSQTQGDSPASASRGRGVQVCTTTPSSLTLNVWKNIIFQISNKNFEETSILITIFMSSFFKE